MLICADNSSDKASPSCAVYQYSDDYYSGYSFLQCKADAITTPIYYIYLTTDTSSPTSTTTSEPSSSTPVGAIVGGVVGGIGKRESRLFVC